MYYVINITKNNVQEAYVQAMLHYNKDRVVIEWCQ